MKRIKEVLLKYKKMIWQHICQTNLPVFLRRTVILSNFVLQVLLNKSERRKKISGTVKMFFRRHEQNLQQISELLNAAKILQSKNCRVNQTKDNIQNKTYRPNVHQLDITMHNIILIYNLTLF